MAGWTPINPHPRISDVDVVNFDYASYAWEDILVQLNPDGIAIVTLNRPKAYNTFTGPMSYSIVFAFEVFDADERVKVVIVTGAGKVFCAGAYLAQGFGANADHAQAHRDGGGQVGLAILRCRKPTIAAINGNAIGIGVTMTLSCDFRLVANNAKVAIPFVQRGIAMEACSSYLLPRLIGVTKTMDIILTGDVRNPSNSAFQPLWTRPPLPQDRVLPESLALAQKLAQNSIVSMALCKAQIWRQVDSPEDAHLLESQAIWQTSRLDGDEGVKSFMEKRKPSFKASIKDLERFSFWPWWRQTDVSLYPRGPESLRAADSRAKSKL
ncbi:related to enoyl-CoA hydratase [Melanopsichium pennsylvanicum]|uniref:Related to enoyl-CoA hydratase n=2 Tax=Melanopsichium pennsylvanicum TaxID=63383 RepID=A0AAJ4XQ48_9BASI|nr:related to enoyl-CoA hydratase [Melanopsichium pennsylvanicum 4]SNX85073.1 related to enoyl-CoA hydratase [Melanopsichium pennsylvanicum]